MTPAREVRLLTSIELFAGCGGLAMGLARSGFAARRMVEWDRHAVRNIVHNRDLGLEHVRDWPIRQEDVRNVDWRQFAGVDLVAGGPPCQPFSVGGKHRSHEDDRDMWPEAVRAVREAEPGAFIFENVRGLTRDAFAEYLKWVLAALAHPHVARELDEGQKRHLARIADDGNPRYRVRLQKVNAADHGAAQKRHRVIILGVRSDLGRTPPSMRPTHSRERLLWDQWVSGEYWSRHGLMAPGDGPANSDLATVRRLSGQAAPETLPWRTVRDALRGLGEPGTAGRANHVLQPGARSYPGHTGSPPDMPAKALKAGVHGVPGGENTLVVPDGGVRYLTVREAARLQGLPDDFEFVGSWSENMRQLGNAVPSELAEAAASLMADVLGRISHKPEKSRAA